MNKTLECLNQSESTKKYSLSRDYFNINKFKKRKEEDFKTIYKIIKKIIEQISTLVITRDQNRLRVY